MFENVVIPIPLQKSCITNSRISYRIHWNLSFFLKFSIQMIIPPRLHSSGCWHDLACSASPSPKPSSSPRPSWAGTAQASAEPLHTPTSPVAAADMVADRKKLAERFQKVPPPLSFLLNPSSVSNRSCWACPNKFSWVAGALWEPGRLHQTNASPEPEGRLQP